MILLKSNSSVIVPVLTFVGEYGKHGAVKLKEAKLERADGSSITLQATITDGILREQAHPMSSPVTGVVQSSPSYTANNGAGGEDIYTITLNTGEGAGFVAGDYLRSQTANKHGVYRVNTVTGDALKVEAANNEMDVANGDTVEKVTPEGWYRTNVLLSHANLSGQMGTLHFEIDGHASATRADGPVLSADASERKLEVVGPVNEAGQVKVV